MPVNSADLFASPTGQISQSLILDLACTIASSRRMRSVLKTRNVATSAVPMLQDQVFVLPQAQASQANSTQKLVAPAGNVCVVVSSDTPVHLVLTNSNGTLDLGQNTMFVLTGGFVSLEVTNDQNVADATVNCVSL